MTTLEKLVGREKAIKMVLFAIDRMFDLTEKDGLLRIPIGGKRSFMETVTIAYGKAYVWYDTICDGELSSGLIPLSLDSDYEFYTPKLTEVLKRLPIQTGSHAQ